MTWIRSPLQTPLAAVLVAAALAYWIFSGLFGKELLAEILIFAIFAMSLDLLVGYAGMVSLGHAAFLAVGAYTTAALTVFAGCPAALAMVAAVAVSALAALLAGLFAVRLRGVFFMMITLAIGQMAYAYFFKSRAFGADDGMAGIPRVDLTPVGIDLNDPAAFALFVLVIAVLVYLALLRLTRSPFGHMLVAIHQNENRLRSLGCPVLRFKLAAYVLAAMVGGLAGSLIAQHTGYISPDLAFWTTSGEALIMVIIGGMGSLAGAAAGAATVFLVRHELADHTQYWTFFLGLFFVAAVLFAGDGFYGALERMRRCLLRRITA